MHKQLASLCRQGAPDGVRSGSLLWLGGQFDRRPDAERRSISAQTSQCLRQISQILHLLGESTASLVKLSCFYRAQAGSSCPQQQVRSAIAAHLPEGCRIALSLLPLPRLAEPGAKVMLEGCAMPAALPRQYSGQPEQGCFVPGVRCGKLIFLAAQGALQGGRQALAGDILAQTRRIMQQHSQRLAAFGASLADVVKLNRWYLGQGKVEDFEPAALACASYFAAPGPAATGIPLPALAQPGQCIQIELLAMLGEDGKSLPRRQVKPEGLWDWSVPLPYWHGLKCHELVFLGGQVALDQQGRAVAPAQMAVQTGIAMQHIGRILAALGVPWADVCKLRTHYVHSPHAPSLAVMQQARAAAAPLAGIALSDLAFPKLAYPDMLVEIDCFAVTAADT